MTFLPRKGRRPPLWGVLLFCVFISGPFGATSAAAADELSLPALIEEALKNSPEIRAAEARASASRFRIPQAKSLPDPMFMIGYQNMGWQRFTYGSSPDAQIMFSASQMLPFPGKLGIKEEMASREYEGLQSSHEGVRLRVVNRVRELYYDLLLVYCELDILHDRSVLFTRIEDAALARYASGMGQQQEVLMAQTEKYMLVEKEEMQHQKLQAVEAMLNTTVGREVNAPLGRPAETTSSAVAVRPLEEMLQISSERSPEIRARQKMVAAAEAKVQMNRREYYPDFTLTANVATRGGGMEDMWSLTAAVNIPLFYRSKQRQAVYEAEASLAEAKNELAAARLMLASSMRDAYSMLKTAERLMELYRDGLVPRTYQDFESAIAGYVSGKIEAITVILRLKALIDYESLYWIQFVEREKAVARLDALSGMLESGVK